MSSVKNHTGVRTLDLKRSLQSKVRITGCEKHKRQNTHTTYVVPRTSFSFEALWVWVCEKKNLNYNLQKKEGKHTEVKEIQKNKRLNCECETINVVEFILHWKDRNENKQVNDG